ncbi:NIPA-like protein 2 [Littorina saxatilis]|uniref:NIPA-like protein 2 n=1 Tax=Littorina saxatilis TaxID=31220 RepID=A0AAN9B7M5_9CAEN
MAPAFDDDNAPLKKQDLFLGSGLAICGNLLISVSLNIQKYTHVKNSQREVERHYTKDPLWWLGLVLMGLGEVGNFTAYGFAPASLVAPLGTTTVIANLFLAAIFLKEKVRPENLFGCAVAIIGAFLIVTFSSQREVVMNAKEVVSALEQVSFIIYVCLELGALGVLLFLLYGLKMKHVVIFLLISSVTASFTVLSAKAVSGMIQISVSGYPQFNHPVLYVMLVVMVATAVIQVKYLNQAMKNFNSSIVVPTNFVFFTMSAILAGIVFYKEFNGMTSMDIGMFILGCLLSFVAVYFITVDNLFDVVKQGAAPQRVSAELVPAWMLANVNVGRVQPHGDVEHLIDPQQDTSDRTPILSSQHPPPITLADELEDAAQAGEEEREMADPTPPVGMASPLKTYGSTQ